MRHTRALTVAGSVRTSTFGVRNIVIRVDPQRLLDVEELSHRMAGQISVGPNRIKMRRKGEGWQADLMTLLEEMAELYERSHAPVAS